MIDVQEALKIVLSEGKDYGTEQIPLMDAVGRFLAEDVTTDRDSPPFDRIMMDGIAIRLGALENELQPSYPIQGIQAAGSPQMTLQDKNHCLEVMTGAILPVNADSIIPYEEVRIENGTAYIHLKKLQKSHIHYQGSDSKKGNQILLKGKKINAGDIGILATFGKTSVRVFKQPQVAIISTGDELINVDEKPEKHQIRKSNVYSLWAGLIKEGITPDIFHITDDKKALHDQLSLLLKDYDVLLLSGGVSNGKYDLVPDVLNELSLEKLFHRVAQRPGKPFWFGKHVSLQTKVFAFPGNLLATFVGYHYYFRQWLYQSLGGHLQFASKALSINWPASPHISPFISVQIDWETGKAVPLSNNGSGDLFSLAQTDGFLLLPKRDMDYLKGEWFQYIDF